MFIKVLKERKKKAESFDLLTKAIKDRYKELDETLTRYDSLKDNDIAKIGMSSWIYDVILERKVLKSLMALAGAIERT